MGTCCAPQRPISLPQIAKPSSCEETRSLDYRFCISEATKVSENHDKLEELAKQDCQKIFKHTSVHACFRHADAK